MSTTLVDRVQSEARSVPHGTDPGRMQSSPRHRVITAASSCVARFGVSKTTVDDIAREARLSRATVYRTFPGGRDEILGESAAAEIRRYFGGIAAVLEETSELEELLVVTLVTAADQIARHEGLRFLLAHEPEVVVPFLSFHGFDEVLALVGDFFEPYLAPWLGRPVARRVAEWLTRLVVSHVTCPPGAAGRGESPGLSSTRTTVGKSTPLRLHPEPIGELRARRLVGQFVMPGIHVLASAEVPEPAGAAASPEGTGQ
ncbi:MAG: TetR/AcrR family transcriptional regulator [Acidimicrobiales bacterium]